MTDREKAIVMAYTEICMLTGDKFQIFHKYIEDILGRPVMTHELAFLADVIKKRSKADFIELCKDGSDSIEPLEPEPCGDAVSRSEALKKFTYNHKGERIPDYDCDNFPVQIDIKTVKEILRDLPSVTPQPKTGHWIDDDGDNAICGCCNRLNHLYGTYCKHCGARMKARDEE